MQSLKNSPLGKHANYQSEYQPDLLFPIQRTIQREKIGITNTLPFYGTDIWNAYEISWLNPKGKPIVAISKFQFPCTSPNIIESKSFKLYLNSFNNTKFSSIDEVTHIIRRDLSKTTEADVEVSMMLLNHSSEKIQRTFHGICLDNLDIECNSYLVDPGFLTTENNVISEVLYSDLLKSNCLVTGQPDWGSIQISYTGKKIHHENLLKYIISFRNHNEFHEHCVERIFVNIMQHCQPTLLTVHARYIRRGGLDINPYRTNNPHLLQTNPRLYRQ